MQVLDVASGTGEPAISLGERVGPAGHVSGLDLSADLLEIATRRAQQRGLGNVSFHPGDAHKLPFANETFDLATCRFIRENNRLSGSAFSAALEPSLLCWYVAERRIVRCKYFVLHPCSMNDAAR